MKKIFLVLLAISMMATMFCACGTPAGEESPAAVDEPNEETAADAPAEEPAGNEPFKMFIVLRQIGDAYYDTIGYGAKAWADTQDDIDLTYLAPTDYDEAQQVAILQDCISQNPDAILLSPISNEACEPVLKEAMSKGIVVITNEAAGLKNKDWNLEYLATAPYAKNWIDVIAEACGGTGEYAAFCGSLQNTGEVTRLEAAIEYQKTNYPDMTFVGEIYEPVSDSADDHLATFKEILTTYPDLVGILAAQSVAQASLAIEEAGKVGQCWTAGEAIPSEVHQYIENGSCIASLVADLPSSGAALASLARAILRGEDVVEGINLDNLPGYDACFVTPDAGLVEANSMLIVTKDNHMDFDF